MFTKVKEALRTLNYKVYSMTNYWTDTVFQEKKAGVYVSHEYYVQLFSCLVFI